MKRIQDDRGQTVVEFTLMLPFILFGLFAIIEFGYAFYNQITINHAASEASRYAAVANSYDAACSGASIQGRARSTSNGLISAADCADPDVVDVRYQADGTGQVGRGAGVAVEIAYTYDSITPLPALANFLTGGLFPESWPITACSDSRLEAIPTGSTPTGADCDD